MVERIAFGQGQNTKLCHHKQEEKVTHLRNLIEFKYYPTKHQHVRQMDILLWIIHEQPI